MGPHWTGPIRAENSPFFRLGSVQCIALTSPAVTGSSWKIWSVSELSPRRGAGDLPRWMKEAEDQKGMGRPRRSPRGLVPSLSPENFWNNSG